MTSVDFSLLVVCVTEPCNYDINDPQHYKRLVCREQGGMVIVIRSFSTSVLAQDPYRYSPPAGGSSNCPTTVVSSATNLA
jgi:hypothetical protein